MEYENLIGFTNDNEIIFAEVSNDNYAAVSFSLSKIEKARDTIYNEDFIRSLNEMLIEGLDDSTIVYLCNMYNSSPKDLAEKMTEETYDDPELAMNLLDCSYYPEILTINNEDYIFVSTSGGQVDTRKDLKEAIDKNLYDKIHEFWDKYHLGDIEGNKEALNDFDEIIKVLQSIDAEKEIEEFISKNKL